MCGAIKPTNPMIPLKETAAAVIRVDAKIRMFFALSTFTPRFVA